MRPVNGLEMGFTELLFRAFGTMNFVAYLAKSNLSYTFLAMVRSPISTSSHQLTNIYLPWSHSSTFMCSARRTLTVQSSGGNFLLPDNRPVRSNPPRGPRRNLARIRSHSSLAKARVQSSCRLTPPSQGPEGRVCDRIERFPHGILRVSEGWVHKFFCRLAEVLQVLSLSSHREGSESPPKGVTGVTGV